MLTRFAFEHSFLPVACLARLLVGSRDRRGGPKEEPQAWTAKAEVWGFVREVSRQVEQISLATPDVVVRITEVDGKLAEQITRGQTTLHDVHYVTEEVVEVLMFNDHYVVHKVIRRERKLWPWAGGNFSV